MGKLTKEDIILLFLEDPQKLANEIRRENVPKSDKIRTLICELGSARCAYYYAYHIDQKPTNETRTATCKEPWYAFLYARDVDKKPTDETRNVAYNVAYKDPYWKREYEQWENSLKKI